MHALTESDVLFALLALAIILCVSRAVGELARRVGQPEVLGQLFAGFLLGPSIFGAMLPAIHHAIFLNPTVSLVLSGFSWIGAVMVLLIAGLEVDLGILRKEAKPGALAAALAIVPSLAAGFLFARLFLSGPPTHALFLGIVLSVTAVGVGSQILIERDATRRSFAQVILAAGVASEVLVWLFVAVVSSFHGDAAIRAGLVHTAYAIGFFLIALTVGRKLIFWAMRRVRDITLLEKGQLTLVLALAFGAAAATQGLGLHALLGAFVVGVILSRAPRKNEALIDSVQSLTLGFMGPIFFTLAGMRINVLQLGSPSAIGVMLLLLAVATTVKVGFSTLGARLGGRRGWESALVGVGLNLKGGSDVVVAVVGTELGLLAPRTYTMYAVVAMLTVLFSPPLMSFLERWAPPTEDERKRLDSEEAERRSYVPHIERVMVPLDRRLHSTLAASLVEHIATSKHGQDQIFDITEFEVRDGSRPRATQGAAFARARLNEAGSLGNVDVAKGSVAADDALHEILETATGYDLIALGAYPPKPNGALSLGEMQDAIIDKTPVDILVAIDHDADLFDCSKIERILVPVTGLEYSLAAGDIAASIAEACNAELVIFHVVRSEDDHTHEDRQKVEGSGANVVHELTFRVRRLGVNVSERMESGQDAGEAIMRELNRQPYNLVVMGGVDGAGDGSINLGKPIETVLTQAQLPAVILISHS